MSHEGRRRHEKKPCQPTMLYPAKVSFRNEREKLSKINGENSSLLNKH
jgi:hypothetical protein